jgi:RNA polymerase sigma-70 factor (ECF subfamily)
LPLPPQQRAAVQLARFEGMSYDEIATVLGVSAGAVDGLLQRARQTLRKQLQHLR